MRRHYRIKLPSEPETESSVRLNVWLGQVAGGRQAELAIACGASQQTISNYKRRFSRPPHGSEVAELIEIATRGFVTVHGWLTADDARQRLENRARAATYANADEPAPEAVLLQRVEEVRRRQENRARATRFANADEPGPEESIHDPSPEVEEPHPPPKGAVQSEHGGLP